MSEISDQVMKQFDEMYRLGRKHGATEELMKVKIEIVELSHNGEIAIVDRYKVEKIIENHIAYLEKDKDENTNNG